MLLEGIRSVIKDAVEEALARDPESFEAAATAAELATGGVYLESPSLTARVPGNVITAGHLVGTVPVRVILDLDGNVEVHIGAGAAA